LLCTIIDIFSSAFRLMMN